MSFAAKQKEATALLNQLKGWQDTMLTKPVIETWRSFENAKRFARKIADQCNALILLAGIESKMKQPALALSHLEKATAASRARLKPFKPFEKLTKGIKSKDVGTYQSATKAIFDAHLYASLFDHMFLPHLPDTVALLGEAKTKIASAEEQMLAGNLENAEKIATEAGRSLYSRLGVFSRSKPKPSPPKLSSDSTIKEPKKTGIDYIAQELRKRDFVEIRVTGILATIASCLAEDELITGEAVNLLLVQKEALTPMLLTVVCSNYDRFVKQLKRISEIKFEETSSQGTEFESFFTASDDVHFFAARIRSKLALRVVVVKDTSQALGMILEAESDIAQNFVAKNGQGMKKKYHAELSAEHQTAFTRIGLTESVFRSGNVTPATWDCALHGLRLMDAVTKAQDWFDFFKQVGEGAMLAATRAQFWGDTLPWLLPSFVTGKSLWFKDGVVVAFHEGTKQSAVALLHDTPPIMLPLDEERAKIEFNCNSGRRVEKRTTTRSVRNSTGSVVLFSSRGDTIAIDQENIGAVLYAAASTDPTGNYMDPVNYAKFELGTVLFLDVEQAGLILRGILSGCTKIWKFQKDGSLVPAETKSDLRLPFRFIQQKDMFSEIGASHIAICAKE